MNAPPPNLSLKEQQDLISCKLHELRPCDENVSCVSNILAKCVEKAPGISAALFEILSADPRIKTFVALGKKAPSSENEIGVKIYGPLCKDFVGTSAYKKADTKHLGYQLCCEVFDYCSFYVQTWFYIVCGVVGILLLVGIAGAVFFFYRKRKRMGK